MKRLTRIPGRQGPTVAGGSANAGAAPATLAVAEK